MHFSSWQTIPIYTQLGLSDKRPVGFVNSSRLPSTFESVAPVQGGSMHAAADRAVTSSQDRDNKSQVQLASPLFVMPKSGGGWHLIIDLRGLNQYLTPPHFKMEGLYMVPNVIQQDHFMAKIDLKDAYLTVPVAAKFHCLLAFPNKSKGFLQFHHSDFAPLHMCSRKSQSQQSSFYSR